MTEHVVTSIIDLDFFLLHPDKSRREQNSIIRDFENVNMPNMAKSKNISKFGDVEFRKIFNQNEFEDILRYFFAKIIDKKHINYVRCMSLHASNYIL